jgi:hypothetical protein
MFIFKEYLFFLHETRIAFDLSSKVDANLGVFWIKANVYRLFIQKMNKMITRLWD